MDHQTPLKLRQPPPPPPAPAPRVVIGQTHSRASPRSSSSHRGFGGGAAAILSSDSQDGYGAYCSSSSSSSSGGCEGGRGGHGGGFGRGGGGFGGIGGFDISTLKRVETKVRRVDGSCVVESREGSVLRQLDTRSGDGVVADACSDGERLPLTHAAAAELRARAEAIVTGMLGRGVGLLAFGELCAACTVCTVCTVCAVRILFTWCVVCMVYSVCADACVCVPVC